MSNRQEQIDFHVGADSKRHVSRIENKYLARKETDLAKMIVDQSGMTSGRFLDIGCGEGTNLHFLKQAAPSIEYTGLDFSPAKIAFMKENVSDVHPACGDALAIPFADETFECILCRDLLHHVYWDREGVLKEASRVLKPGGKIIVLESDGRKILNRIFRFIVPAEKGMKDSIPLEVLKLCENFGPTDMHPVEASFMLRAAGFVLGPARGLSGVLKHALYGAVSLYEKIIAAVLPTRFWFYWMFVVRP